MKKGFVNDLEELSKENKLLYEHISNDS